MPDIEPELLRAYMNALYRIEGATDFRIGEYSPELAQFHIACNATHSDFLTAFNPASKRLPAEENARRHTELGTRLDSLNARKVAAAGLDPAGHWPPEPGYLVFDLPVGDVIALGRAYGQNAIVRIGTDAVPRLIWIAPPA